MTRLYRNLDDKTKHKISQSMSNRPKSDLHKANISKALKKYWEGVPSKPQSTENKDQNGGGADNGTKKTN